MYQYEKNHIEINNNSYSFEFDIRAVIEYKENYIVLLAIPFNKTEINNIYCLDAKARLIWQVEDLSVRYPELKKPLPYEQMGIKDDIIFASDFYGRNYQIKVNSGKIEGRMKTALYVATVARTYRKAIDDYLESPEKYQENMPWYLEQIKSCTYRQFTTGFFYGKPSEETQIYDNNTYEKGYTYLGIVGPKNEKGMYRVEQKNKFSVGEQIEVMKPDGRNVTVTVRGLMDEKGEPMESCPHPQQIFYVDLGMEPDEYDILRRREEEAIALD